MPTPVRKTGSRAWCLMALIGALFLTQGCATTETAVKAEGKGEKHRYAVGFEEMWATVPRIFENKGLFHAHIVATNREAGNYTISAWVPPGFQTLGHAGAVFVRSRGDKETEVEVVVRGRHWIVDSDKKYWLPRVYHLELARVHPIIE